MTYIITCYLLLTLLYKLLPIAFKMTTVVGGGEAPPEFIDILKLSSLSTMSSRKIVMSTHLRASEGLNVIV